MTSRRTRLAAVLLFALALAACGSNSRSAESHTVIPQDPGDLKGSEWVLVETGDSDAVPAATSITLNIGDGTASGNGPCNRYHLDFTYDGNDLTTGPVASTRIASAAPLMSAEQKLFHSLEVADTIQIESDLLVLSGPEDVRLSFAPVEDATDISGNWDIVEVASNDALRSVVAGTTPTVDFASNGTLTVDAGCNPGGAEWHADGKALTIGPVRSTLKVCSTPAGVMEQEANIFAALPRTATVELAQDTAVLLDKDGATVLVLARDS